VGAKHDEAARAPPQPSKRTGQRPSTSAHGTKQRFGFVKAARANARSTGAFLLQQGEESSGGGGHRLAGALDQHEIELEERVTIGLMVAS
jgi:nanoRNase/pAp phosphatase (c-di-AMP/oligoRNAs hydrolase)